jgi:hypothetical protein
MASRLPRERGRLATFQGCWSLSLCAIWSCSSAPARKDPVCLPLGRTCRESIKDGPCRKWGEARWRAGRQPAKPRGRAAASLTLAGRLAAQRMARQGRVGRARAFLPVVIPASPRRRTLEEAGSRLKAPWRACQAKAWGARLESASTKDARTDRRVAISRDFSRPPTPRRAQREGPASSSYSRLLNNSFDASIGRSNGGGGNCCSAPRRSSNLIECCHNHTTTANHARTITGPPWPASIKNSGAS